MDCIATAEEMLQQILHRRSNTTDESSTQQTATVEEWRSFIDELKRKEALEKARTEARERARTQANEE
jgi:hypothetical protein